MHQKWNKSLWRSWPLWAKTSFILLMKTDMELAWCQVPGRGAVGWGGGGHCQGSRRHSPPNARMILKGMLLPRNPPGGSTREHTMDGELVWHIQHVKYNSENGEMSENPLEQNWPPGLSIRFDLTSKTVAFGWTGGTVAWAVPGRSRQKMESESYHFTYKINETKATRQGSSRAGGKTQGCCSQKTIPLLMS